MFRFLIKVLLLVVAFFVGAFALLTLLCHASGHEALIMLHMYLTPAVLSGVLGLILLMTHHRPAT
ncbi:hypothetical protein [Chelativorans intermedius]|uniref:Uncharacterized protein n=1 Tax=Chelativorans intermedius TaxID=515947 RepID=A0ABV6DBB5_9HYPH|nr:hypothetical protein [Chelativorans intermedius]MCT9000288.1 hypothetical protein [Chelativorans intermedius]